jgi:hypothetical protein
MNIFALWCDLVEEITSRNLTRETDKLPTIPGLASALAAFVRDIPFIVDKNVSCSVGHLSLMTMSALWTRGQASGSVTGNPPYGLQFPACY